MPYESHFYTGYTKASRYTLSYPLRIHKKVIYPHFTITLSKYGYSVQSCSSFPNDSFRGTLPKSAHLFSNSRNRSSFPSALTNNFNYIPSIGCIPHINPNATSKNDYFQQKNIPNLKSLQLGGRFASAIGGCRGERQ